MVEDPPHVTKQYLANTILEWLIYNHEGEYGKCSNDWVLEWMDTSSFNIMDLAEHIYRRTHD